jgi:hypothetical protein
MSDTLSLALFHPKVMERTNIFLKSQGYALEKKGKEDKPFLSIKSLHTNDDIGIRLTQVPTVKTSNGIQMNRMAAWFSFENPEDADGGIRVLKSVAQAEKRAHELVDNITRPNPKAITMTELNSSYKGRMAQSQWHQDAGPVGGDVPEPNAVKAITLLQSLQLQDKDGGLKQFTRGEYLTQNAKGEISSLPEDTRLGILFVDRTADGSIAEEAARRSVSALKTLRSENIQKSPNPGLAVIQEPNGHGSVVSEDERGTVKTWKTYGTPQAAQNMLTTRPEIFENKVDTHSRNLTSINDIKKSLSR